MWEYRAICLDILDGDTLRLLVDTGFYGRQQVDLRLLNVTAPELRDEGGIQTKEFVQGWVGSLSALKWPLLINTTTTTVLEPSEIRSFTRYVGEVRAIDTRESLNDLVRLFLSNHPGWGPGE